MEPEYNITVDSNFIAMALASAMQIRGDLEEEEFLIVHDMMVDDQGLLKLLVEKRKATIN